MLDRSAPHPGLTTSVREAGPGHGHDRLNVTLGRVLLLGVGCAANRLDAPGLVEGHVEYVPLVWTLWPSVMQRVLPVWASIRATNFDQMCSQSFGLRVRNTQTKRVYRSTMRKKYLYPSGSAR